MQKMKESRPKVKTIPEKPYVAAKVLRPDIIISPTEPIDFNEEMKGLVIESASIPEGKTVILKPRRRSSSAPPRGSIPPWREKEVEAETLTKKIEEPSAVMEPLVTKTTVSSTKRAVKIPIKSAVKVKTRETTNSGTHPGYKGAEYGHVTQ